LEIRTFIYLWAEPDFVYQGAQGAEGRAQRVAQGRSYQGSNFYHTDPFSRGPPEVTKRDLKKHCKAPISNGVWGKAPAGKLFDALICGKKSNSGENSFLRNFFKEWV